MPKDSAEKQGFSLPFARIALILAALVALTAIAVAVLRSRGAADAPAPPAAAQPVGDVASMIGGLEKKLAANPTDPKGWNLLGIAYYNVGRYRDAVGAYSKAAALDANNPATWSALGEVQLLTGAGGVTPEAEASFRKALAIDPGDFRARYFMAVKKDQVGEHKAAIDELIAVLRDSPADAPWLQPVRELIQRIATEHKIDVAGRLPEPAAPTSGPQADPGVSAATDGIPGPNAGDLKAASAMTPSQQDDMARAMVARLAARLEANPKDLDGWMRLMRARMVLNDPAGAQAALGKAKAAYRGDTAQTARFEDAARALGISGR